ncbi:MAG TPA: VanW family protein [Polyangiales bacterium]|nr:VanW family protein [Polyangiales bacterium]
MALVACVLACGALAGFLAWPKERAHAATPVEVRVAGEPVDLDADLSERAQLLAQQYLRKPVTLSAQGHSLRATRAALGGSVDVSHLTKLLTDARDARSPLRRAHAQTFGSEPLELAMPAQVDEARATEYLLRLKDQVDSAAVEPRVDPRAQGVVPARAGTSLDVFSSLDNLDRALAHGDTSIDVALRSIGPKQGVHSFAGLDMRTVLGEFETRYNRGNISADRTHNLKVAASHIDGYVLQPGEVFDFNALVGDRTTTNGFVRAPVIADGELVDGMGGGTCQIASTLHAAVFFAGLPILTRFPHSRPSFYIKLGLDATVVYGQQNFRFQNDRSYPIVIGLTVNDGSVHATLHGPVRDHAVTLIRHIDAIVPFTEHISEDPSLPTGLRVLVQRGVPGFKITRFRVIEDLKNHSALRERTTDSYPPTTQLWRVGTGNEPAPGFERPKNDAHPEYVADEYLAVSQSPEQGTFEVAREPGRSGTFGWTEREGMVSRKP